jgi:hypothetical protein
MLSAAMLSAAMLSAAMPSAAILSAAILSAAMLSRMEPLTGLYYDGEHQALPVNIRLGCRSEWMWQML